MEDYGHIIKHDPSETDFRPCPHLIDLYLVVENCSTDMRGRLSPLWESDTVWTHPLFSEIDHNRSAWELMSNLADGSENEEFLPDEPHRFVRLGDCWPDFTECDRLFEIRGTAVFARDAANFVRELVENVELRRLAQLAGRDTHKEWEEIKQQRQREEDEAILREELKMEKALQAAANQISRRKK